MKHWQRYQKEFDAMKPLVLDRSKGRCEARLADRCLVSGAHVHHRKYRSRGGSNGLSNLIHVCLACHEWIHTNPELANVTGLSLHEWENEDD